MKLDYIREFCILAENGNYLDSSDQLYISQSTLTRHIQALETQMGVPLFTRTTHKVELNNFGSAFYPYAKLIAEKEQLCRETLLSQAKALRGRIRIGAIPMMAQYDIAELLVKFKEKIPEASLQITESESAVLKDLIRNNQADFAFVREIHETEPEFEVLPISIDSLIAVLPASHPLAKSDYITLSDLQNENFLFLPEDTLMYHLCISLCQKAGFAPNISFTDYNGKNIINLVSKGMGCSLLMKRPAIFMANPNTSIVDISPPVHSSINMIYLKGKPLTNMCTYFLSFIQSQVT